MTSSLQSTMQTLANVIKPLISTLRHGALNKHIAEAFKKPSKAAFDAIEAELLKCDGCVTEDQRVLLLALFRLKPSPHIAETMKHVVDSFPPETLYALPPAMVKRKYKKGAFDKLLLALVNEIEFQVAAGKPAYKAVGSLIATAKGQDAAVVYGICGLAAARGVIIKSESKRRSGYQMLNLMANTITGGIRQGDTIKKIQEKMEEYYSVDEDKERRKEMAETFDWFKAPPMRRSL